MEYKVVPFTATLNQQKETSSPIANQLEKLIAQHTADGWAYVRLESVSAYVQSHDGCL